MSFHRRVFAFLAAVSSLCIVIPAQAQLGGATIALGASPVTHSVPRTNNRKNDKINYDDCFQDDVLTFSLTLTNRGSYILQAWAGSGCDMLANRTNTNTTLCWKLYDALPTSTSNPNAPTVDIHVRDLLAGKTVYGAQDSTTASGGSGGGGGTDAGGTAGTGGTGGDVAGTSGTSGTSGTAGTTATSTTVLTLPAGTLVTGTTVQACTDNSGIPIATPISVYFMLVDGNSALQGSPAIWPATYKLLAPNPPDTVSVDIGEDLLPIHFSYTNNQSGDMTINGYNIFCDPPPGQAAAADAGLIPADFPDAGDAGIVMGAVCGPTSNLMAGQIADVKYKCGSASLSATAGIAGGLVNGVPYHVGVSATDTYDNVGKLSVVKCAIPQPVNGFFKTYRLAGGQGGGGFCSFSSKREPMALLALLGVASCFVLRRRRAA